MTQTGYIRIKEKYEEGGPFVNGFVNVGFKNGEIGFINLNSENGSGYIDKYGKIVIPFNYSNALPFNEGYAAIRINHLWGFVYKTGKIVISPQYDEASNFMNGLAFVVSDAFCGYIDKNGNQIIPRQK